MDHGNTNVTKLGRESQQQFLLRLFTNLNPRTKLPQQKNKQWTQQQRPQTRQPKQDSITAASSAAITTVLSNILYPRAFL